ncbi:MAG: flavodoxin family protein [Promethearchaeota archaeon]|jgi:flavodoxin
MKIVIIYETRFGNTKKVAEAIGEGLSEEGHDVKVNHVKEINLDEMGDMDLIVIGSPTYAGSHVPSIRKFINNLSGSKMEGKSIIAYDTHSAGGEGTFLRKAVFKMEKQIKKKLPSMNILMNGRQFKVHGIKGPLIDGELEKCKTFGKEIASNL